MGRFKELIALADKGADIVKEGVVDKDKAFELKYTLEQMRTQLLLSGAGASVTKWTICILVGVLVLGGLVQYYIDPSRLQDYYKFVESIRPIMLMLIGAYGGGKMFKNSKWSV